MSVKLDSKTIAREIEQCANERKINERLYVAFSIKDGEVVFSGHNWGENCGYSERDMQCNGHFQVIPPDFGPGEKYRTFGAGVELTQRQLETLYSLQERGF